MNKYKTKEEELVDLKRVILDPSAEPIDLSLSLLAHITGNFSAVIGSGGSSKVYKGLLPNGLCIAVKRFLRPHEFSNGAFMNEMTTTISAKHKNIARLVGYCHESRGQLLKIDGRYILAQMQEMFICLEYLPKGDLERYITHGYRGHELDQRCLIMKKLGDALFYLHEEARIVHGDLKLGNILLDNNNMPKICDFGSSLHLEEGESVLCVDQVKGTIGYMAPEMVDRMEVSFKTDIYSLGMILRKLFNISGWTVEDDIEQTFVSWREILENDGADSSLESKCKVVRSCLEIAYKCTEYDQDERPTALDIIKLLDEIKSTNSWLSSCQDNPVCQLAEDEQAPTNVQYTKTAETSSDHLPGRQEPDVADTDAQTSTQKHDKLDLEIPLSKKIFSLDFIKKITKDFSEELIIVKKKVGASGLVYKGTAKQGTTTDVVIAVKRLFALPIPKETFTTGSEELMDLDHDNIVKLVGYCHDTSERVLTYKGVDRLLPGPEQLLCYVYMPNGSLLDYITGGYYEKVEWQKRYEIIRGTCQGLCYIHEDCVISPVVHLNLSLSNILLDEKYAPRIADTGVSSLLVGETDNKTMADTMAAAVGYMAPEYSDYEGELEFPEKADIFSLGIVILEIVTGEVNHGREFAKIVKEKWTEDHIQSAYSSMKDTFLLGEVIMCIEIGLQCANSDQHNRPTAGQILHRLNDYRGGNSAVPVVPLPISTEDGHNKGKESTPTTTPAPVIPKKPGFWGKFGKKRNG